MAELGPGAPAIAMLDHAGHPRLAPALGGEGVRHPQEILIGNQFALPHAMQDRQVQMRRFGRPRRQQPLEGVAPAGTGLPIEQPVRLLLEFGRSFIFGELIEGALKGRNCHHIEHDPGSGQHAYLPHPAHKEIGKILRPYLDKVLVVDFVAQD